MVLPRVKLLKKLKKKKNKEEENQNSQKRKKKMNLLKHSCEGQKMIIFYTKLKSGAAYQWVSKA